MDCKYKAINIVWETDGDDITLPTEVELPNYIEADDYDAINNYLSDEYGFLVINYDVVEIEFWKRMDFPYFDYEASNLGRIRNKYTKHVMKQTANKSHKNPTVRLNCFIWGQEQLTACYLVYETFNGSTKGHRLYHKDGNKFNNRLENLYLKKDGNKFNNRLENLYLK